MELDRVDRITAGAVGEPGERTFYLQARQGPSLVTFLVEKQQVELLAASVIEILDRVGRETEAEPEPEASKMELETPLEPLWRVGRLAIGYEEDRDLILLQLDELIEGEEGEEEEEEPEEVDEDDEPRGARVRMWATPEQMLALARHAIEVASRGRPRCEFCGNPMDPDGHTCPAMNGHGRPGRP